jgi:hypothetical protein
VQLNREQSTREVRELGLPEFFVELFAEQRTLRELEVSAPSAIFETRKLNRSYHLIPIFEFRGQQFCCELHPEGSRFVAFHLERPEETKVFGRRFQCALAALFIEFWQDERNDLILPMLAESLEFDYLSELLEEIGEANKLPRTEYLEWQTRFCAACGENEIPLWENVPALDAVA